MPIYRVETEVILGDGSTSQEVQHVEIPEGQQVPEGAVLVPEDYDQNAALYKFENGAFSYDLEKVSQSLVRKIRSEQIQADSNEVEILENRVVQFFTWMEAQDLKANQAQISALSALDKAKRLPFHAAYVTEKGQALNMTNLNNAGLGTDSRLWETIRRMAIYEARAFIAEQAINSSSTKEQMENASQINWNVT